MRIQIGGNTYTTEDIKAGRHLNDPNIDTDESAHNVTNISHGGNVGIQAGRVNGTINID